MKLKKAIKKNPIAFVALVLLGIALAVSVSFNLRAVLTKDHTVVTNDSIREEIVPVARLAVYDYNFTQVLALTDAGNILNWENPITTKRYVATIDGSASIEVDVEQITVTTAYSTSGAVAGVTVHLPHCDIGDIALDHDSLKEYVNDNGFFNINPVTTVDLNELEAKTQAEQRQKLEESDVLQDADMRVQELITAQIQTAHGEDVVVTFDYLEEADDAESASE